MTSGSRITIKHWLERECDSAPNTPSGEVLHQPKNGEHRRNKKRSRLSRCEWRERLIFLHSQWSRATSTMGYESFLAFISLAALPAWPKAIMRAMQTCFMASRAGFRYSRGSKARGFSAKIFRIAPVMAMRQSVSTLIFRTPCLMPR